MPPDSPASSPDASSPDSSDDAPPPDASDGTASAATLGQVQEPQRLHPYTLLLRIGASLPALGIILLPVYQNPSSENLFSVVLSVVYGLVALPAIVLQYLRFSYRITPKQIVIQKGVFNRQNRSIPIERVQNVEITQNLRARVLGVAQVKIETAGSSSTEGSLEYVSLDQAHEIRRVVRSFQHKEDATAPEEAADATDEAARGETLFAMTWADVLLSGAFRFSLLYIALIFSVFQFFDPELIVERVLRSQGWVERLTTRMAAHPALTALATVAAAAVLGWISGILVHLYRYYGFRLWLDDDKLRKRHGLSTVTEGTIPLKKVQALILHTNPLMRAFGWYELKVQTIGTSVNEEGHRVVAPFVQWDDLLALARRIRSFSLPDDFRSVSRLTIRRMFVRYTAVLALVLAPATYYWPTGWWHPGGLPLPAWGVALVPLLLGWAVLQYRNHGYATQDDGLYVRRGVLSHYLWVLPTEKLHVFATTASLFQQRLGLKTLYADTAGAATFAYPEVVDLPADEADAQLDRLHQRFNALYRRRIEAATGDPDTRLAPDERPRLPVAPTTRPPDAPPTAGPAEAA